MTPLPESLAFAWCALMFCVAVVTITRARLRDRRARKAAQAAERARQLAAWLQQQQPEPPIPGWNCDPPWRARRRRR